MGGLGHFLASLFSSPRVTSGALATAAALYIAVNHFGAVLPLGPVADTSIAIAWATALFGGCFFALTLIADGFKWLRARPAIKDVGVDTRKKLKLANDDVRAIVAFLAVRNEPSVWLMQDHPGAFDFRALGFGRLSDSYNGAGELTLDENVRDWLQDNLAEVKTLTIPSPAVDRLTSSHKAAGTALEHRWMTY